VSEKKAAQRRWLNDERIVDVLAAAYRNDDSYEAWRRGVMKSLLDLNPGAKTCTWFEYDSHIERDGGLVFDSIHSPKVIGKDAATETWLEARQKISPHFLTSLFGRTGAGTSIQKSKTGDLVRLTKAWRELWRECVVDSLGIVAVDPGGQGVCASVGLPEVRPLSERQIRMLERVAVHLSAGRRLQTGRSPIDDAEAVLTPTGKVLHAHEVAKNKRDSIEDGRRRRDEARKTKHDAEKALEIWRGLVAGRWSLVDHFDTDGKRLLLAMKNTPNVEKFPTLSANERRVCALVAMGHRDKEICYMLGLTHPSVTATLHRARSKLKVTSRTELAARWRQGK
jgi:DNA-binding CsgD family transcriptional regulator